MFVNDILDDLKRTCSLLNDDNSFRTYIAMINIVEKDLTISQKFHVGDIGDFIEHLSNEKNSERHVFMDIEDIRLPFKICWFSYTKAQTDFDADVEDLHKYSKGGILARELASNLLHVDLFAYHNSFGMWQMCPVGFLISVNKAIRENSHVFDYVGSYVHPESLSMLSNWTGNILYMPYAGYIDGTKAHEYLLESKSDLTLLELSLKLLSCHNITTQFHTYSSRVNKKRKRRGLNELFSYYTLILKPMGKQQQSIPQHLWNNRIHFRRGHFKNYTPERPLFGKITGRFWWQPSVCGRNKKGIVMKDYAFES